MNIFYLNFHFEINGSNSEKWNKGVFCLKREAGGGNAQNIVAVIMNVSWKV